MKTAPLFKEFFRKTANKRAEIAYTFVMSLIFVRTILIFITLLFIMRLMGKRQIGEMQPYELVITLIIADLACIPMADPSVPLLYGLVAILAIYLMHQDRVPVRLEIQNDEAHIKRFAQYRFK